MKKTRFELGLEMLEQVDGSQGAQVIERLKDLAPDLGAYIVEFAFGDIYSRQGLDLREREMITLASLLTAGGCEPQLEVHIHGALNAGMTPETVIETFLQCVPYTGFPKVLNAVFAEERVFRERGLPPAAERQRL